MAWQETDLDEYEDEDLQDEEEYDDTALEKAKEKYSPTQEAEIKTFASAFLGDVRTLAKQYMEHFFKDKMLHCGGKIPKSFLFAERRVSMVLNYDIIRGVERIYSSLEDSEEIEKSNGEITNDIKLVNETLKLLSQSGIPQQFAGGMMCLYLEFVEGIDIGTGP